MRLSVIPCNKIVSPTTVSQTVDSLNSIRVSH